MSLYNRGIMADGYEDLRGKNNDDGLSDSSARYGGWLSFQGREDAEMLREKSAGFSAARGSFSPSDDDVYGED